MLIAPQDTTIAAIGILLLGIIVGAIAAWLVLPSRRQLRRVVAELESLRSEHATYRANVTTHFETTSELVANMTASYKAVYDHLATGAQSLCDSSKALEAGEFGAPRLVFDPRVDVERLEEKEGARGSSEPPAARPHGAAGTAPKSEPTSGRGDEQEGPVLEMTKAATANTPAHDEDSPAEEKQEDDERPSIH